MESTNTPKSPSPKKGLLDNINSKSAFGLGIVASILILGTVGFIILSIYMLSGGSDGSSTKTSRGAVVVDNTAPPTGAAPSAAAPGVVPAVTDADHVRGNPDGKVTFIEYSDFECPFCTRFTDTVDQILAEYDDIRFVYRHFPLSFHPEAEPAANAAECAGEQGKFWEYHDELFANSSNLGSSLYDSIADDLRINNNQFQDCLETGKYLSHIRTDSQEGAAAGVSGTPGSFIIDEDGNAVPIKGALPYSSVKPLIDAALAI